MYGATAARTEAMALRTICKAVGHARDNVGLVAILGGRESTAEYQVVIVSGIISICSIV